MVKKILKIILLFFIVIILAMAAYIGVLFFQENQASRETTTKTETLGSTVSKISYVKEDTYNLQMKTVIEPYLKIHEKVDYLHMEDGADLRYKTYKLPEAKANIVIAHGMGEFIEKFNEVIYCFLISGYNVYILEDRGMGESTRYVDNKELVYINGFQEYVFDFEKFCNVIVDHDKPMYLFSHSMGGAVSTCFMEQHPDYFEKAVLSSPMIKYSAGSIPNPIAKFFSGFMCFFGQDKEKCLGQPSYSSDYDYINSLDDSEARYTYVHTMENDNENFRTSAPTYGWLRAASYDLEDMYKAENLEKINTKCLVFKAGNDTRVKDYGEYHFVNNVADSELCEVPNVKHEIYLSKNNTFIPYMDTILEFFQK